SFRWDFTRRWSALARIRLLPGSIASFVPSQQPSQGDTSSASQASLILGVTYRLTSWGPAQFAVGADLEASQVNAELNGSTGFFKSGSLRFGVALRAWLAPSIPAEGLDQAP